MKIVSLTVRTLVFLGLFVIVGAIGFWAYKQVKSIDLYSPTLIMPLEESKKVALIIAFKNFKDEEYFGVKQVLKSARVEVITVSTQAGKAIGVEGGEAEVNLLTKDLDITDFDGVTFIGGSGCLQYLDNEDSYRIIRKTISQGKILGAICISPVILAKSGVLEGKKATVWSSILDKKPVRILEENGAVYIKDESVVVDGKIITGDGPAAAKEFGKAIIEALR